LIVTGRLELRPFRPEDTAELHEIFSDPETHTIGQGPFTSLAQTAAWISRRAAGLPRPPVTSFRPGGAAVLGGGDAVPGAEGAGEVRGAAESMPGRYLGHAQLTEPGVGEVVAAPAQPLLADPAAERDALSGEQPVQLPDRDVTGQRDGPR
jgi:hypothetical protein